MQRIPMPDVDDASAISPPSIDVRLRWCRYPVCALPHIGRPTQRIRMFDTVQTNVGVAVSWLNTRCAFVANAAAGFARSLNRFQAEASGGAAHPTIRNPLHRPVESHPPPRGDRGMQMLVGLMFGAPICAMILWAVFR